MSGDYFEFFGDMLKNCIEGAAFIMRMDATEIVLRDVPDLYERVQLILGDRAEYMVYVDQSDIDCTYELWLSCFRYDEIACNDDGTIELEAIVGNQKCLRLSLRSDGDVSNIWWEKPDGADSHAGTEPLTDIVLWIVARSDEMAAKV